MELRYEAMDPAYQSAAGLSARFTTMATHTIHSREVVDTLMDRIAVANEELATVRDAMRRLNQMVAALEKGDLEKVVLTNHNQMCAVVLSISEYMRLMAA